ncbi:hypothetical protein MMC28_001079 [Mycoblastus sanguinarius]|nr:hypothetical protein [Mycoblastus sanguinarius]
MSNGPLPTTLSFLSSLPSLSNGSKVRFLGCVTKYTLSTGTLELQHTYPPPPAINVIALVDVTLLLEGLKREDMQVGEWVNVVGYVEEIIKEGKRKRVDERDGDGGTGRVRRVRVKAVMLWSAGGVRIGDYERAMEERMNIANGR